MKSSDSLRFRPHHFLCTIGYEGKGYSPAFVENYNQISEVLRNPGGENTLIEVTADTDSICEPCPSKRGKLCETQETIQKLDHAHQKVLGISVGAKMTWKQAQVKMKSQWTVDRFHQACEPCSWKKSGMCEKALTKFLSTPLLIASILYFSWGWNAQASVPSVWNEKTGEVPASIEQIMTTFFPKKSDEKTAKGLQAPKALQKAWTAFQKGTETQAIQMAQTYLGKAPWDDVALGLSALAQTELAQKASLEKKYSIELTAAQAAIKNWNELLLRHPYSAMATQADEKAGLALVFEGEALAHLQKNREAILAFQVGLQRLARNNELGLLRVNPIQTFAETCKKHESLLCRAWIQRILQIEARGSPEWNCIEKIFPEQVAQHKPSWTGTRVSQTYKAVSPDTQAQGEAFQFYLEGKTGKAVRAFETFIDEFPRSKLIPRVRFWLAQSLSQENEHAKAHRIYESLIHDYPLSFHSWAASSLSGISLETAIQGTLPNALSFDRQLTPSEQVRLDRAILLLKAGALDLAAQEIREIKSREKISSEFLYFFAHLAHKAGAHLSAFGALSELIDRGSETAFSTEALKIIFPIVYWDLIKKYADEIQLDPVLALSLMKQESGFEYQIGSSAGAQGLMQLMPATAIEVDSSVERALLSEPDTNIRLGTKYLKKMIDRFGGNIAFGLAAYNAGPNAVDRWIKENRAQKGLLEFIEQIPFGETQNYVGSIIKNYYWYSKALGLSPPHDLAFFFKEKETAASLPRDPSHQ